MDLQKRGIPSQMVWPVDAIKHRFVDDTQHRELARASPIDDERQPQPTDPSAYHDEAADKAAALNAIF